MVATAALVIAIWKDIVRDRPKLEVSAFFAADASGKLVLFLSAVNIGRRPISVHGWVITLRDRRKCVLGLTNFILDEAKTWNCTRDLGKEISPKEVIDIYCNDAKGREWHLKKKSLRNLERDFSAITL